MNDIDIQNPAGWHFATLVRRVRNQINYMVPVQDSADFLVAQGLSPAHAFLIYHAALLLADEEIVKLSRENVQ